MKSKPSGYNRVQMEKTVPQPNRNKNHVGYVLNSEFSDKNKTQVQKLQNELLQKFGNAILLPQPDTLHITLMDWLAPLVNYPKDKDSLFKEIEAEYNAALQAALSGVESIGVTFSQISASTEAIFISGHDQGQYQQIRQGFLDRVELLPNTKLPPKIIHSTIARFNEAIDLEEVRQFVAGLEFSFIQQIDTFRLLRTRDTKMEAKNILKLYHPHS